MTFSNKDLQGIGTFHDDAIVISALIAKFKVKIFFVNTWNETYLLFYNIFS